VGERVHVGDVDKINAFSRNPVPDAVHHSTGLHPADVKLDFLAGLS